MLSQEEFRKMSAASSAVRARRGRATEKERWERRHRAQSFIQGKELDELELEVETGLYENVDLSHGSRLPIMVAHTLYSEWQRAHVHALVAYMYAHAGLVSPSLPGFLWWSVFDALSPMLWFFPLCALEVSGYEPIILLWFSPLLALWAPIRRALATPSVLLVLRLLTLVGVASYQSPTSLTRLVVLSVGNMFALLTLVAMWWGHSKLDRF